MEERILLGALAIALGVVAGTLLFAPFVALSHRRRGGLGKGRLALWAGALVSFVAIWAYTVLPLPDPAAVSCAGANLRPFAFAAGIRDESLLPAGAITDPAVLHVLLDVLMFVPLGFFVRVLGGRGIVVAALAGLGVSAVVELTQLTGVWGLAPCAYRVVDVDDLLANTLGAVIGSVLALAVPRRHRGSGRLDDADRPRRVTGARRVLAMTCDVVGAWLTSLAVGVFFQLGLLALGAEREVRDGGAAGVVAAAAPIVLWLVFVLVTGRTVGDVAIRLRYEGGGLPIPLARFLRYAGGIGTFLVLFALPGAWDFAGWIFTLVSVIVVFATRDHRGLPGILSAQRLVDEREPPDPDGLVPRISMRWR
ncbi:VanZ family protein [Microbacterium sulfonylureivorans]|uniref:VanZ family protein n=1 Tax=Microbacterium sulfonylureivorans TaxID=2486854 RepID=UPI001F0CBADD|nr:VanZ family protein [Microbacterium sulfonylureivorans]